MLEASIFTEGLIFEQTMEFVGGSGDFTQRCLDGIKVVLRFQETY